MQGVDTFGETRVLPVACTRPTLSADPTLFWTDTHASFIQMRRSIRASIDRNAPLKDGPLVQRITLRTTGHIVSLIPPLTPLEANPHRFLALIRGMEAESTLLTPSAMAPVVRIMLICEQGLFLRSGLRTRALRDYRPGLAR
jgi:hypothetical protein